MKCKKLLSTILATAVIISSFAAATITANAETTAKKTMNMGSSVISASAENAKDRDIIYYGDAKKWRVLSTEGNTLDSDGDTVKFTEGNEEEFKKVAKENALFVISENDFGKRAFDINGSKTVSGPWGPYVELFGSNIWQGSDAQKWCNGMDNSEFYDTAGITLAEINAILTTTKVDMSFYATPKTYNSCGINDKVFYLSIKEANTYFANDEDGKFAPGGGNAADWWLRSPRKSGQSVDPYTGEPNNDEVAIWDDLLGDINTKDVTDEAISRPAFNLNLSSVLFTSAAKDGKVAGAIGNYSGNEWKLTLKDSLRLFAISNVTRNGNTLTVLYQDAKKGSTEKISYIITDKDKKEIKYYGNQTATDANGSIEITLPDISITDRLFVFNEQVNGDCKTDYSSELQEVEIFDTIKLNVSVNDSTMGSVTVSPEKVLQGDTVTLTATANSGYKFVGFESEDVQISTVGTTGTFVVPNKAVTVTANFEPVTATHKITVSPNYDGIGTVEADKTSAQLGETVTLTAAANPGNTFVEFASPDVEIADDGTFVMPNKDVFIQAKFKANAEFKNNTDTPVQVQKNPDSTALLRFMWGMEMESGAYIKNIGAYIIPWDLFDKGSMSNPSMVIIKEPDIKNGDTFSADHIGIPFEKYDTEYCAIPFVNGTLFTEAMIKGSVNQ